MTAILAVVRHGIFSDNEKLYGLENALAERGFDVDNRKYEWSHSVLLNGLFLANQIAVAADAKPYDHIVLVGHSQGGLVCRIAAAALCAPGDLRDAIGKTPVVGGYYRDAARASLQHIDAIRGANAAGKLRGVVTLATPNSGAITFGQLSLLGKCFLRAAQFIGELGVARDLTDLTSDRLFRILQHVRVQRVFYLSISGSAVNRFSFLSHADLSELPLVGRLGVQLSMPNDWIVEDESVAMENAVLPPEVADLKTQYEHVRSYRDCSDVSHTGIHANAEVHALVIKRILAWCP